MILIQEGIYELTLMLLCRGHDSVIKKIWLWYDIDTNQQYKGYLMLFVFPLDGETSLALVMGFLSFIGMVIMITYTVSILCLPSPKLYEFEFGTRRINIY